MDIGSEFLSQLVINRTYAEVLQDGRKEDWSDICKRVRKFFLDRYPSPHLIAPITSAMKLVERMVIAPSMRLMQFAGEAVKRDNIRAYNCSLVAMDSIESFGELTYVLMCGTGAGFSVLPEHITMLPIPLGHAEHMVIEDSREGWADSVKVLIANPDCTFDYSHIRPPNTPLSTGGTASGPDALRIGHERMRSILTSGKRLSTVDVFDICCIIADFVVVGGVRRAATIAIFSQEDEGMLQAKDVSTEWWIRYPWRARANISCALDPDTCTEEEFSRVFAACITGGGGEPGFLWVRHRSRYGCNPCQPAFATVLTPEGVRTFADIDVGSTIWSGKQWTKVTHKVYTGVKEVWRYETTAGAVECTEEHRVFQRGVRVQARHASTIDSCSALPLLTGTVPDTQSTMDGLVLGDGSVHKASNNLIRNRVSLGEHPVWDITVEADEHSYWSGGHLVSNCAEISLRYQGLCNLTEVCIARCGNADEFIAAVGYASLLGTLQAGLTDFHYLRPIWQQNARDEALLGVSITGLAQRWELLTTAVMDAAVAVATYSNQQAASTIGIQPAKRIFCAKPSGSVSAVYGCTSGIAAAYSEYIIRRVRIDKAHPLAAALQIGLDEAKPPSTTEFQPVELDTGSSSNLVVSIPLHYKGGITTASETSIQLLERMLHFTKGLIGPTHFDGPNKHNVSLTCHYLPHELADIKAWLWEHRQDYSGVTLYPRSEAVHAQMPFEAITEARYHELVGVWGGLYADFVWEAVDYSHHSDDRRETAACAGGACEVQ